MHTVRNRVASKPRQKGKAAPPPVGRVGNEQAFLLRHGNPPAFPAGLFVPPPRGAVIASMPWPDLRAPEKTVLEKRLPAKPVTRRKPATRKRATARKGTASTRKVARPRTAKPAPAPTLQALPEPAPAMFTQDLLDRALAMRPEPATTTSPTSALPPAPAQALPPFGAGASPIPRSRAISVQRGGALRDVIAQWLGEAGRWLSRLCRPGKSAERAQVARANARHRALQSQFEALEALREVAKAD